MRRKFFLIILVISFLALFFRLAVCYELFHKDPQVVSPSSYTDMATYIKLANSIRNGTFKGEFYYQPFYYAVYLPVIYTIFSSSAWSVLIVQSILGALTVYVTSLSGALLYGRKAGLLAGALVLLSKVLIFFTPYHLIATLQAFWVILLFYLVLRAQKRRNWYMWGLCGLVSGLAILTRGNVWFFVPGILAIIVLSNRRQEPSSGNRSLGKNCLHLVIFLALLVLPQLPFAWHNTKINKTLTGPSTAAEAVLGLGNTPEAPAGGRNPELGPGPMEYPPTYKQWMADSKTTSVKKKIINWFFEEPLSVLELTFRKLLLFWDYREIPNNISLTGQYGSGPKSTLLKVFGLIPTYVIISFAICGMLLCAGSILKKRTFMLLFYFIAAYWLATAAFYILARFRVPVIPLLAIFAAIALLKLYHQLRAPNRQMVLRIYLPAMLFSIFTCFLAYNTYRSYEPVIMRIIRPSGVQVSLTPTKEMRLDNGPMTFGDWQFLTLNPGTIIKKRFADFSPADFRKTTISLPLIWSKPGMAQFLVNGKQEIVHSAKQGLHEQQFQVTFYPGQPLSIQLVQSSVPLYVAADFQRNYNRTAYDNNPIPAELVCRLYAEK